MAIVLFVLAVVAGALPCAAAQDAVAVSSDAACAILYEPMSGRVLFEQQAHSKRAMASTTKLMTALLAAEMLPTDAVLTASAQALDVEGSSLGLCVGDTVSRNDLLYGLLLSSGNDAANVFALSIADSYEAFAELMNTRAAQLGMTNTCFVTPSGLDAEGHGASAYDMALLASEVLKNDLLATICATQDTTVLLGDRSVHLTNHNRLLAEYDGAIGMKTGYTSKAGRCLVSAATRDGVTLIAVTLDCSDDWNEHKALLDAGFSLMTAVELCPSEIGSVTVLGGEKTELSVTVKPQTVALLRDLKDMIKTDYNLPSYVWAPVQAGDTIGTVRYMLDETCLAEVPITAATSVLPCAPLSWWQKTEQLFRRLLKRALT